MNWITHQITYQLKKFIGILYIIFGVFAGLVGTSFSILIKIKFSALINGIKVNNKYYYPLTFMLILFTTSHSMDVAYCASKEIMSASQKELTESNAQMLLTLSGIAGGTAAIWIASKTIQNVPNSSWATKAGIFAGSTIPLSIVLSSQVNQKDPIIRSSVGNLLYKKIIDVPVDMRVQNYVTLIEHELKREEIVFNDKFIETILKQKELADNFMKHLPYEDQALFNQENATYIQNILYNYSIKNSWIWKYREAKNPLLDPKWINHSTNLKEAPTDGSIWSIDHMFQNNIIPDQSIISNKKDLFNSLVDHIYSYSWIHDEDYILEKSINNSWDYISLSENFNYNSTKLAYINSGNLITHINPIENMDSEISMKSYDFFEFLSWWYSNYPYLFTEDTQILHFLFMLIILLSSSLLINIFFIWQNFSILLNKFNLEFSNKFINAYVKRIKNFPLPYWYCLIIGLFNLGGLIIWRFDLYETLMYMFNLLIHMGIISI